MEMKYLIAIVIGIVILLGLYLLIEPKITQAEDLPGSDIKVPNPACYSTCAMTISKEGGSFETCAKKCNE